MTARHKFESLASIIRSASFRRVASIASAFTISALALFGFIYWQTAHLEIERVRQILVHQADGLAAAPADQVNWMIRNHLIQDFHRVSLAALLDRGGAVLAGNLERIPPDLPADGKAHLFDNGFEGLSAEPILAIRKRLPDGREIIIGRNIDSLSRVRESVLRALMLGLIPLVLLALTMGAVLARRTDRRLRAMLSVTGRFQQGDLAARLPIAGAGDEFDQLAAGVNAMLNEIESLMARLRDTGNNIAHDLRTPLTRLQALLERLGRPSVPDSEVKVGLDRAIAAIDQLLGIINALLRIAEIENVRPAENFGAVDLADVLGEMFELYEPIAEESGLRLGLAIECPLTAWGDRDLISEAVANLVDNAVKFTPRGGAVMLSLSLEEGRPTIAVSDTGPGIPPAMREQIFQRFYRADRSRHIPGHGLGLNLVAAIVKMHGFAIEVADAQPGCRIKLICGEASEPGATAAPRQRGPASAKLSNQWANEVG